MKKYFLLIAAFMIFAKQSDCHGALILTINTLNEEYSFGGTDTVPTGNIFWFHNALAPGTNEENAPGFSGGLNGRFGGTSTVNDANSRIATYTDELIIQLSTSAGSLTGNGTTFDYSGLSAGNKAYLAGLNGETLTSFGGATDNIAVTVVPEPSEYALAFGLGAIVLCGFRTYHRAKQERSHLVT